MLYAAHPEYRIFSLLIFGLLWGGKAILHKSLPHYVIPTYRIINRKKVVRKISRAVIAISLVSMPLQFKLRLESHNPVLVRDNSISMSSEDMSPTRLEASKQIIKSIWPNTIPHCYSFLPHSIECKRITTLNKTGTSITDLVLLAHSDYFFKPIIVLSDGGANNGISFSQSVKDKNNLIWIDIAPLHKDNLLILSGHQIKQQNLYTGLDIQHYIQIPSTNSLDSVIETIKTLAQLPYDININTITIAIILHLAAIISGLHFFQIARKSRKE